jgi:fibronectin-binding autotransporter adhesin
VHDEVHSGCLVVDMANKRRSSQPLPPMKKLIHTSRVATLVPFLGISLLLSGLLAPQLAQADTGTWNGTNGATWDINASNWTGVTGTPWDSSNGLTNTALFSTAANATVSGTVYANTITIDGLTTITGGTITLSGSNPTINGTNAGINIIYSVIVGTNGLVKSGTGLVYLDPGNGFAANTFSGDITINGGNLASVRSNSLGDGAGAITINTNSILNVDWATVTRTGLVTVKDGGVLRTQGGSPQLINNGAGFVFQNGAAITTSLGGSGGLTVTGARSYLYSANTYTGGTVISNGGDLALLFGGALPTNTAVDLSGNFLAGNQNNTVGGLTGASTGRLIGDASKTFTVNKASGTDSYGGTIETWTNFIKDGAGTLSLTNANNNTSFPGALTVNNGVLELGGAGRFAAGSYSGAISLSSASSVLQIATSTNQTLSGGISGSGSLTKSGTGTLTLSGSNSYAGGTTVSGGTLTASHANALGDAAGAITVTTNGVLMVNANMTRTGTVTLDGGDLGTGNGSTLTINGGGFVFTGGYASAGGVVLAGSSGLTVSSPDGRLWAQATYTGDTVVNSGLLRLAGVGGIPTNSAVSIASGAAVNLTSYFAPTGVNRTIGGLTGAGVLYGVDGTVTVDKTSGSDTFSGDIQGGQGLIKAGAGTLVLAGTNTYSGATLVSGGTLALHGNSSSAQITISAAAVLDLRAAPTATTTGSVSFDPGSSVSVSGTPSGPTVTLLTASGGISGTPSLVPVPGYALVVNPNSLVLQASGSTFSGWLGTNAPTPQLLTNYAFGAVSPTNALNSSNAPTYSATNNQFILDYFVRTGDTNLVVQAQATTDLAAGPWTTTGVSNSVTGTNTVDGVTLQQRRASVPITGTKKFLRLWITE